MYVIDPTKCSHPARIMEGGKMKCLVCGAVIAPEAKPAKARKAKTDEKTADRRFFSYRPKGSQTRQSPETRGRAERRALNPHLLPRF